MQAIDLTLQCKGSAELTAHLYSPAGSQTFTVPIPPELAQQHQSWLRRFLSHHDPATNAPPAEKVSIWGDRLVAAMERWLALPAWLPLQQTLAQQPLLPLRLRCQGADPLIERLPWEAVSFDRPFWRLGDPSAATSSPPMAAVRRPRLLLLIGREAGLGLERDIDRLQELVRQRRIELLSLRGPSSCLSQLRSAIADPLGWDGLIFLGHSSSDPQSGGRLQLANGEELSGGALAAEWRQAPFTAEWLQAPAPAPPLLLLGSCSGMDLARSGLAAGMRWALCFREVVPTQAASLAFCALLDALERGLPFTVALDSVRKELQARGPVGCHLLLSAVGAGDATDLVLPLSRRRRFRRRLATSRRSQAIAAAALVGIAAWADLLPVNPLSTYLLDRRLYAQKLWRQLTAQSGPRREALPVLLLDTHRAPAALGVAPDPDVTSRAALAELLQRTPVQQVPLVGIDLLMDQPAAATGDLAGVIRRQKAEGRTVVAGRLDASADDPQAGLSSMPQAVLLQAGLQARNLGVGIPGGSGPLKPPPLRLLFAISNDNFAGALSGDRSALMPADAVIDWSLDWDSLVRPVGVADLPALRSAALIVGSDGSPRPGRGDGGAPDRFSAAGAIRSTLARWGGTSDAMPGPLLQAALAQSLALRHWLTPLSLPATTALAAGGGVLLAAGCPRRSQRLVWLGGIAILALPNSLQLAVSLRLLVPLLLPYAALCSTALLRRD